MSEWCSAKSEGENAKSDKTITKLSLTKSIQNEERNDENGDGKNKSTDFEADILDGLSYLH